MKSGDRVRYKTRIYADPINNVSEDHVWKYVWLETGLLIEFNMIQRTCVILDDKTGKIVKKHCSDVQLLKVGHESR